MNPSKPHTIFDTTVVAAAAFNPSGVSRKVLRLMENGEVSVVMSNRIRSEYELTLFHPAHAKRLPFLTTEYLEDFLQRVDQYAERVPNPPRHVVYKRDVDDEPFINLAIEMNADFLVTLDKDLLHLPNVSEIAARISNLSILRPGEFMAVMERRQSEANV